MKEELKTPPEYLEQKKMYQIGNKEQISQTKEVYFGINGDSIRKKSMDYHWLHREDLLNKMKDRRIRYKTEVINHYSNGSMACSCCGVKGIEFLTIDHENNDGAAHRRTINKIGTSFYRWLINNLFPTGYRVSCYNCNCGRKLGVCPHITKLIEDDSWEWEL